MVFVSEEQVWDLYIAGYTIKEIAKINSCSENTIRNRIKNIKKRKSESQLKVTEIFNISDDRIKNDEEKNIKPKRICDKNVIIKMYLDGYKVKEISIEKKFDYYDVQNVLRNFKREIGYENFKKSYEKVHIHNRVTLKKRRKEEQYIKEILKTTGMDVKAIISDRVLVKHISSQYIGTEKAFVLTKEGKKTATWDMPTRVDRKIL